MKNGTSVIILLLVLTSCTPNKKAENKSTAPYNWLLGEWHPNNDTTQLETWNKISSLSYTGMGLKHAGTDSMQAFEFLRLYKLDNKWQYSAIVDGQNEGKEIIFTQEKMISDSILHIKNMEHDFPKSIWYECVSDSLMTVVLNKGLEKEYRIEMRRKE
jgi:hypothetical protein